MKSIRRRITVPLIISAVLIPLVILLAFNVVMRFYMQKTTRDSLQETATITQTLIRQQLLLLPDTNSEPDQIADRLANIRALLRTTSSISESDMLVIANDGQVLFPSSLENLGISQRILGRIRQQTNLGLTAGSVETLTTISGQVMYLGYPVVENRPGQSPWIIYLVRYSPTHGLLLLTNLLLVGVLVAGSLASILWTRHTARHIQLSLLDLSGFAKQVGQGSFETQRPEAYCTEISGLKAQFNKMAIQLERADSVQKTFLQNASHELRTPLQAIQGYAEGLENGVLEDVPRAAGVIRAESIRLSGLVESLLTLSRIDNPAGKLEIIRLNPSDWLCDLAQRFRGVLATRKSDIAIQLEIPDSNVEISTDETLLNQVISNLLTNAVRHARQTIRLTLEIDQSLARFSVRDDGSGIAAEDLPHLFKRFYRGENGQFGLGLAIAQAAATALGGTLVASNDVSGGAVFTLSLPLEQSND